MRIRFAVALLALTLIPFCGPSQASAQESSEAARKVVSRVTPQYPNLARSMNIKGTVKMLVVVEPNGSAKSIQVKGGNPVLVQSAEKALHDWKWEPAAHASSEVIEIRFDPR
jgi:TonB family protein